MFRGKVPPAWEGEEAMAKLTGRYAQVVSKGGPIELVTREVPDPKAGEVRVRVQTAGLFALQRGGTRYFVTTASTGTFDNFRRYEGSMRFGTIGAGAVGLAFGGEALARGRRSAGWRLARRGWFSRPRPVCRSGG